MHDDSLRILLIGDYPPDPRLGSPKVLYKLRDEFIAAGHQAELLLSDALGTAARSRHLRDVTSPSLAWRAVKRLIAPGHHYDVIDASGAEAAVIASCRGRTETLRKTAVIARSHGLEHLNYRRMLDDARDGLVPRPWYRRMWYPATRMPLVARAARRADKLIVLNEVDRSFAIDRAWKRPEDVVVIPHGLSDEFFRQREPSEARAGLLFCGSWDAAKGIHYLVRAFGELCSRRPNARLTVVGAGVAAEVVLRDFPEQARTSVRVVPRVDERGVVEEFRRHAALVMCSTYEGFGMVVPEAMALGLAVIATPVGAATSLVRDHETGIVVPARDPARLARAMERALNDDVLRARIGAAAREAVRSLTWPQCARRTLDVYRAAIWLRAPGSGEPAVLA